MDAEFDQLRLEIQLADTGQADIQHEASRELALPGVRNSRAEA